MKSQPTPTDIIIYQTKSGAIELRQDLKAETIWATQAQIVQLFEISQPVVSRHINNIFRTVRSTKKAICKKCILQIPINQSLFKSGSGL